jgi:MFS family permease
MMSLVRGKETRSSALRFGVLVRSMTKSADAKPEEVAILTQRGEASQAEWRTGWTLVMAGAFGVSLGTIHIYSLGVFMEPIEAEFGWTRAWISAGLTICSVLAAIFSPAFGILLDRWGARRLVLPAAVLYCLSIASLSLTGPSIWSWWMLWFAIGATTLGTQATVWSAAVSGRFTVSRGLALAVTFSGTGIGSTLVPVLSNALIEGLGWRGAYRAIAAIFAVVVLPILWLFFHDDRAKPARTAEEEVAPAPPLTGWTVREGLRRRQFYQLGISAVLVTAVIVGFIVHLVPLLSAQGLERDTAVRIAAIVGVMSITGRLSVGYLFDRLPGPPVGFVSVSVPALSAALLLLFPGSLAWSIAAVIVLGLSVGGEYDAVIYLSTRFFGLRNLGTLFGFTVSCIVAGVGIGPIVPGILFDATGSYESFLIAVIPTSLVAGLMLATLGPYPDHEQDARERAEGSGLT